MDENDQMDVESVISTHSKRLGSKPVSAYITESKILLGNHEIQRSKIEDIKMIRDERTDYAAAGLILINAVIGVLIAYLTTTYIPFFLLIVGLSALLGYTVVQVANNEPYGYVMIKTYSRKYKFGISDSISAARLFGTVYDDIEEEFTHEALEVEVD